MMLKTVFLSSSLVGVSHAERKCTPKNNLDAFKLFLEGSIGISAIQGVVSTAKTHLHDDCEKLWVGKQACKFTIDTLLKPLEGILDEAKAHPKTTAKDLCSALGDIQHWHLLPPFSNLGISIVDAIHGLFPVELEFWCGESIDKCSEVDTMMQTVINNPTYNAPINANGETNKAQAARCQISDNVTSLSNFPIIGSHNSGGIRQSDVLPRSILDPTSKTDGVNGIAWDQEVSVVGQLMHGVRFIEINSIVYANGTLGNFTHSNTGPMTTVENMLHSVHSVLNNNSCANDFMIIYNSEPFCENFTGDCGELAYNKTMEKAREIFGADSVVGSMDPTSSELYNNRVEEVLADETNHSWRGKKFIVREGMYAQTFTGDYDPKIQLQGCQNKTYFGNLTRVSVHAQNAWTPVSNWVSSKNSNITSYSDFVHKCDTVRQTHAKNQFVMPVIYSTNSIAHFGKQYTLTKKLDQFPWSETHVAEEFRNIRRNNQSLFTNTEYPSYNSSLYYAKGGRRLLEESRSDSLHVPQEWISV